VARRSPARCCAPAPSDRRVRRTLAGFALAGLAYNYVRFGAPTEFGHSYSMSRQQAQIEQYGLASYHYLARNLAVAFTLLPELVPRDPYADQRSRPRAVGHSPILVLVLWPPRPGRCPAAVAVRPAWRCVAASRTRGWVQFATG